MSSAQRRGAQPTGHDARIGSPVVPFLIGTAVGGLAGAVVGTLLSGHATHLITLVLDVVERRDSSTRNHPAWEYMVQ